MLQVPLRDAKGTYHDVYAFRLTDKDPVPYDKPEKYRVSLRDLEKKVEEEVRKGIDASGGRMTVSALVEKYTDWRVYPRNPKRVKQTTEYGYGTVKNFLEKDPFGKRSIKDISRKEAKIWFTGLQADGKHYSSLNHLKGILKPAFQYALESDWVSFNPFDFKMDVLVNDSHTRESIYPRDMRRFLDFVKTSKAYQKYYDLMFILFDTGLRISELCGLTLDAVDIEHKVIHVRQELMYKSSIGLYIDTTKSVNGYRDVPMLDGVDVAFQSVIENRPKLAKEPVIWDKDHEESSSGFLFFTREGKPMMETDVDHYFMRARERFNTIYKDELPVITPHVCRHTFCSNMATRGMPLLTLKTIMGHADVTTTANTYTHVGIDVLKDEMQSAGNKNYVVYAYDREAENPALDDDMEYDD